MDIKKFTFSYNSSTIEKLIYFIVAITFVAPLLTSLFCFFAFMFIGIDTNQEFRYVIFGIFEIFALFSFLAIYN